MTTATTTLSDDAAALRDLYEETQRAKNEAKELDKQYKAAQIAFLERMEEENVDGLKVDGINFVPASTIYAQIQDRAAFVEWAQDHAPELIETKERTSEGVLNERVRADLDDGRPLPPGLGFYVKDYISQRAA